jgi:F-type H+-transporting ATPase subunit c
MNHGNHHVMGIFTTRGCYGMSIAFQDTALRSHSCCLKKNYQLERRLNMYRNATKILFTFASTVALWLLASPVVFAADAIPAAQDPLIKVIFSVGAMIGAGLAIGLGCIGAGAGIGNAAAGASEAVGRNPAAQGKIMMTMMVGMAMAESIAIYALVITLILIFANPYKTFLFG